MAVNIARKRIYAQDKLTRFGPHASALIGAGDLEALCDLSDAAEGAATFEGPDGTPFCPVCDTSPEHCNCELRRVRAALARVDGTEQP